MEQYNVIGMSCAACSSKVENAVKKVPGVTSCAVNLLTNSMGVEGNADTGDIISAVQKAGYNAVKKNGADFENASKDKNVGFDLLTDSETPKLVKRLVFSLIFLALLMYLSMGHMMWGFPLPSALAENHIAQGIIQLILAGIVMVINQKFFINGFKGLMRLSPNMDSLVSLGSAAAFVYSTFALLSMTNAQLHGDHAAVMSYMHEFYFESAAMILALITVGKLLEARSKGKTTDAIKGLMKLAPQMAVVIKDGKEMTIAAKDVKKGDLFVVRPGETVPVDGIITEGGGAVNESALTGESIPVDKGVGDTVSAATINQSGFLKCEATRVGEDTTLSQIIKLVSDAAATKAPAAKAADKVSGIFVPVVITIAVITTIIWIFLDRGIGFALARGISVLVISCPCALGLATPVAIMVGNGVGAKNGILFKTASALEGTGKVKVIALDKTGTITTGEPNVTDVISPESMTEAEFVFLAYSLEKLSSHPISGAVCRYAEERGCGYKEITDFKDIPGSGIEGVLGSDMIFGGNYRYVSDKCEIPEKMREYAESFAREGKTPVYIGKVCSREKTSAVGVVAVADIIKPDSEKAIRELKNMGIHVVMLTGDNKRTAEAVGVKAGVDEVIAEVLPDGKERAVSEYMNKGKVAMVGDGINDAPALTRADIGIAIGAGTDIAIDAADVVLMKNTLSDVAAAVRISRASLRVIHENLFWAFIYNVIGIPLAAGVFISFGLRLNPMFAAAAMSISSFIVVTNALRLNFIKVCREKISENDKTNTEKETEKMEKKFKVEGMMCVHCEARVKKCLEELAGVTKADVSHKKGTAIVYSETEIADDVIIAAITEQGYKVK